MEEIKDRETEREHGDRLPAVCGSDVEHPVAHDSSSVEEKEEQLQQSRFAAMQELIDKRHRGKEHEESEEKRHEFPESLRLKCPIARTNHVEVGRGKTEVVQWNSTKNLF